MSCIPGKFTPSSTTLYHALYNTIYVLYMYVCYSTAPTPETSYWYVVRHRTPLARVPSPCNTGATLRILPLDGALYFGQDEKEGDLKKPNRKKNCRA